MIILIIFALALFYHILKMFLRGINWYDSFVALFFIYVICKCIIDTTYSATINVYALWFLGIDYSLLTVALIYKHQTSESKRTN